MAAVVVESVSSIVETELVECVLLCRSWEKWRAIEDVPEEEKSFCVSRSWKDVVEGRLPVVLGGEEAFFRFASDALRDGAADEAVEDADESLNPDVDGEVGDVGTERLLLFPPLLTVLPFCAMAFCSAALFIDGLGVSSSSTVGGWGNASPILLIVGGSDSDESSGTSRTRQENTSDPSSKMDVSGKEEKAILSRSSLLIPSGG